MSPNDSNTRRPMDPIQAILIGGGGISLIFGLVGTFGPEKAFSGTGLVVFAGLCLVAAAIRELTAKLDKNR